ncbi:MAG: SUMF1/EgtB/PvdO family nonheme iron enzyme [Isosphaerales bacterium]
MSKIFLSYRRQDSAGVAGRIYDRLCAHFGTDAVFMDIDSIPPGEDFREHIDLAVGQCDVVLAVIGTKWAGESDAQRRLDDPKDFVRIELESALHRNLPVIPILIDHRRMPGEADLPPSLARLAYHNATDVDQGRDFNHHVKRLIRGIEFQFQRAKIATARPSSQQGKPATSLPGAKEKDRVRHAGPSNSGQRPKADPQGAEGLKSKSLPKPADVIEAARPPRPAPAPPIQQQPAVSTQLHGAAPTPKRPPTQPGREWTNSIGIKLVRIGAGEFLMGSPHSVLSVLSDDKPQHRVRITKPFYLGIHEVTQDQYRAVMGDNPSHFKGSDDLPVESVSWLEAVKFCNKLSEREKRTPFYRIDGTEVTPVGGDGYRLPTEAEWEYACRAKSTTLYPFGDDASKLGEHAWSAGNSESKTHPVGQKLPNASGLYDMLGNVWEWCADWYDEKYYASSPPADPPGAPRASHRVFRAGVRWRRGWRAGIVTRW